jgi:hypothetical protein
LQFKRHCNGLFLNCYSNQQFDNKLQRQQAMRKSLIIVFSILILLILGFALLLLILNPAALVVMLIDSQRDTDVTMSSGYNFSSFSGTVWKTKVKTAVIYSKTFYENIPGLFPPDTFDPADSNYRPIPRMKIITTLPAGARLHIGRLMKDNGEWGGVWVTASMEGLTNQDHLYLDPIFLTNNRFLMYGSLSSSTNWTVNTNLLEKP